MNGQTHTCSMDGPEDLMLTENQTHTQGHTVCDSSDREHPERESRHDVASQVLGKEWSD